MRSHEDSDQIAVVNRVVTIHRTSHPLFIFWHIIVLEGDLYCVPGDSGLIHELHSEIYLV